MRQAESNCTHRAANVEDGNGSFHLVMACAVKQVTESDGAYALASEICGEPGGRASEEAYQWIEFLSAVLQVGARDGEIRAARSERTGKQEAVLFVEKFVLVGLGARRTDECARSCGGRLRRVRQRTLGNEGGADRNREDCNRENESMGPMRRHRATARESGSMQENAIGRPCDERLRRCNWLSLKDLAARGFERF